MNKSRTIRWLCGLFVAVCIPLNVAHAQSPETWVSRAGSDGNNCTEASPCQSLIQALSQTVAGGQITMMDASNFGTVIINKSVTIVNETSGTASVIGSAFCFPQPLGGCAGSGFIQILAGPSDVVTLRGLTVNNTRGFGNTYGIIIMNARQVNIEKCVIFNQTAAGIGLVPFTSGTLASSISLKIEDTIVTSSSSGLKINSAASMPVNISISRSSFQNNNGGGIRLDTTAGAAISAAISDSTISLNAGNGINAVAGTTQNIVAIRNSVIAKNGAVGVQANGVNAGVLLEATLLDQNVAGATSVVNSGNIFTFGNNSIVGSVGSGFNQTAGLQ